VSVLAETETCFPPRWLRDPTLVGFGGCQIRPDDGSTLAQTVIWSSRRSRTPH